ncbi:MAG TPA: glycosyltransferase family 1 protein [Gemmatimonadaceae bacterium]|nr:glycosyltransferase family 1 protein [Gemmatimonadaceae bacterium]
MLTIALDAEHTRHSIAGIARYARSLAAELRALRDLRVFELGGGEVVGRGTFRKKLLTARHDLLWYPLLARQSARDLGADVYHSPLLRGPLSRGRPPFVMTVHDLVPVRWPETMPAWHRWYTGRLMRRLLDAADRLITVSDDTANDLNSLLGVASDKIRVVPNGVDAFFFDPPPSSREAKKPYVLFVGTPEPRKNLGRLLSAMSILRGRGVVAELVIVGSGGWGTSVGGDHAARWVGRVTDAELHTLYANAECLALPSLHEGFGLPALEAMATGTPVVAGSRGALPEVTGGAAVLVDPEDATAIADGIEHAVAERTRFSALGRARAREFSWQKTATLTAAVYREVA